MNQVIDLRPVCHRREDRIRAHVLLRWLALLLARIAENACGDTWPNLRRELDRIHVGTFTGPAGTFRQRTEITKAQRDILHALKIDVPRRIYQLKPSMEPKPGSKVNLARDFDPGYKAGFLKAHQRGLRAGPWPSCRDRRILAPAPGVVAPSSPRAADPAGP